ncbi:MAG: 16S rRNA (cytosine(1402)-N(4))-methyltransferase RsmH [Bacteroidales bacterium]|jgi:16S rRNA (cytosine1402-N4)-methyltransferase|nr:16S rRNA (cytosine(1402)-N(4))-methyltransferase RsmH [Bacteroidales bacterium]
MYHNPVLLTESIEGLNLQENGVYVDATFGGGGHSKKILEQLKGGRLLGFDQDEDAQKNILNDLRFQLIPQNFKYAKNFLQLYNALPIDGLLVDLGVSSHQFDVAERGFSFRFDAPLDLRMDVKNPQTAASIIEKYDENQLADIFYNYGELRNARRIASVIVQARAEKNIKTTGELKNLLTPLFPKNQENKFLSMVFQALRIEVNQELDALKILLQQSLDMLCEGGRLVVISYHSLEDRLVKNFIKTGNLNGEVVKDFYGNIQTPFRLITRKAIVPSDAEIAQNNRARSAKLRIAERQNPQRN